MEIKFKTAVGDFFGIAGFIGVIAQLLESTQATRNWALITLFVVLMLIGGWIIIPDLLRTHLANHVLPPVRELEHVGVNYQVTQATRNEIGWIAEFEAEVYSREDAISEQTLLEWYTINPNGFSIVKMADGKKIGHIDILPLRPNTLDVFLNGNIVEQDIRGDSLYKASEQHLIKDLYVESIILRPPKPLSNTSAILCVLSNIVPMIERIASIEQIEYIYAIAASSSGEKLLRHLGFDVLKSAAQRKDNHDLFRVSSSVLAEKILTFFPNQVKAEEMLHKLIGNNSTSSL